MTWFRVDDGFPEHPKLIGLERDPRLWADAVALWLAIGCYCARTVSDGFIPMSRLRRISPLAPDRADCVAAALADEGLLEPSAGGYQVHDWADYNPTRDELADKRRQATERQRRRRRGLAAARSAAETRGGDPSGQLSDMPEGPADAASSITSHDTLAVTRDIAPPSRATQAVGGEGSQSAHKPPARARAVGGRFPTDTRQRAAERQTDAVTRSTPGAGAAEPADTGGPAAREPALGETHSVAVECRHPGEAQPIGVDASPELELGEARPAAVGLDHEAIAPSGYRRALARLLWAHQGALRARLDPTAPALVGPDRPGGPLDAVVLCLARFSPAQCRHALDIFAVEAECLRDVGDDPLKFLNGRTNWKPEPFERAAGSTVEAVRKRFAHRRSKRMSGDPGSSARFFPVLDGDAAALYPSGALDLVQLDSAVGAAHSAQGATAQ